MSMSSSRSLGLRMIHFCNHAVVAALCCFYEPEPCA
jgi:hypothetical protein